METTELTKEQQLIAGLRELADFLKDHPEMHTHSIVRVHVHVNDKAEFVQLATMLGAARVIDVTGPYAEATLHFTPSVSIQVFGMAERICERVESTETVTTTGWAIPSDLAGA